MPTLADEGYEAVLARTAELVRSVAKEAHVDPRSLPIGVGMPGSVTRRIGVVKNSNTACLNGRPFRDDFRKLVGQNVRFENDANCFAVAEARFGAGKEHVDGVVFGVILARLSLFSEAEFKFQRKADKSLYGTEALAILEDPWPNGSTGELLARMEQDVSMAGNAYIRVEMATTPGGVEVTLTDYDVDRFDVTKAPDANINLPIEERRPGGLGLHLIRRLVDSLHYEYSSESRQSRTTFRKTQSGRPGSGGPANTGG